MICTFFGHRNAPSCLEPKIGELIEQLIEEKNITCFYIGNNGNFDNMVFRQIKKKTKKYPCVRYYVVLAYLPSEKVEIDIIDYSKTIYPQGLESIPPRFAISKRNQWMVEKSDIVVTYVKRSAGGAAQAKRMAEKKGKAVIEVV